MIKAFLIQAIVILLAIAPDSLSAAGCSAPRKPLAKPAELPRVFLNTDMPILSGRILAVNQSCSNLQSQIRAALGGDIIMIPAGTVCVGNFVLPRKETTGWVVIATENFVVESGNRVTPAQAGSMAKIMTPNGQPALATAAGAHHYRLIGLEIGVVSSPELTFHNGLVTLGDGSQAQVSPSQIPYDLVLDHCYIHGNPTLDVKRGVAVNSNRTAIVDSYISDIHTDGFDAQAICGWNSHGPFKIVNNHLEASGENVLFGGALGAVPNVIPADIEIRGNYFFKPLSWKRGDPAYAGRHWTVKNSFELKNASRVLLDNNVFLNNWDDSQPGFAIVLTVRVEGGAMPWNVVEDVTFTNNIVRNSTSGFNFLGKDANNLGATRRVVIRNNIIDQLSTEAIAFQFIVGNTDVTIDHNTVVFTGGRQMIGFDGEPGNNLVFTNNIAPHAQYGVFGGGMASGKPSLERYTPSYTFSNNVVVAAGPGQAEAFPECNLFAAKFENVGFADLSNGLYGLSSSSRYYRAAADHRAVGADVGTVASLEKVSSGRTRSKTGQK